MFQAVLSWFYCQAQPILKLKIPSNNKPSPEAQKSQELMLGIYQSIIYAIEQDREIVNRKS